jgi:hypothetical protein
MATFMFWRVCGCVNGISAAGSGECGRFAEHVLSTEIWILDSWGMSC